MSRGPGKVQRLIVSRLRRAGAPLSTVDLAGAVYGAHPSAMQIGVVLRAIGRLAIAKKPRLRAIVPRTRPRTWEATLDARPKRKGREDLPGQFELETFGQNPGQGGIGKIDGSKDKRRQK
jgi:hypothetical protein